MAQQYSSPFPQEGDSTGLPYSGGTLTFYKSGSSTKADTYSDEAKSTANANPLTLNSTGRPDVHIFLQDIDYKVVLADSSGNTIWTADPVRGTDFDYPAQVKVGSGAPTGSVAGTAGSNGVVPTFYWDYTNKILYVCTTTGTTSTAAWTSINASAATATVTPPQGYLTLVSGTPVIASDQASKTAVYYTPDQGNQIPIYDGASFTPTVFTELTLDLVSAHSADTIYDIFVFSNSGVLTLVTGPAWDTSTAGSGDRGSGASTTELQRISGYHVNAVSMTGRNGNDTYSVDANLATYVGSILIDGTAGQVTCTVSFGQSRIWGLWNAYNRNPIIMSAGDSTASWAYTTASFRASNADDTNKITVLCGLAEENIFCTFKQYGDANSTSNLTRNGIGVDSTTTASGKQGQLSSNSGGGTTTAQRGELNAEYTATPLVGAQAIQALEQGHSSANFYGTESDMRLTVRYRG